MNNDFITVTELNRYLSMKFEQDMLLKQVYLQGEISNFKRSGQHYYFSIKDEFSEISAMFFYPDRSDLNFIPQDGMSVQVVGKVQVYQKRGTYSIIVSQMEEVGLGLLYQKFLKLKEQLEKEGLFDPKYKKPIPEYPEKVGIITALTGEAINDIVSTFNRRLPLAELIFFPAIVQGEEAPKDLIRALKLAYAYGDLDVLIIGRGGGSFEDLNCFNDEALVRLLFESPYPTVSAVGHEGDYTICDFVASYRAPTPTGAAMRLSKDRNDVLDTIISYAGRLKQGIKKTLVDSFNVWDNLQRRLNLLTPEKIAEKLDDEIKNLSHNLDISINKIIDNDYSLYNNYNNRMRGELITTRIDKDLLNINNIDKRISTYMDNKLNETTKKVDHLIEKMTLLNPLNIIKKGYTIVYLDDKIVYDVNELKLNDELRIKFNSGNVYATVNNIEKEG